MNAPKSGRSRPARAIAPSARSVSGPAGHPVTPASSSRVSIQANSSSLSVSPAISARRSLEAFARSQSTSFTVPLCAKIHRPRSKGCVLTQRRIADRLLPDVRDEQLAAGPDGEAVESLVVARAHDPAIDLPPAGARVEDGDTPPVGVLAREGRERSRGFAEDDAELGRLACGDTEQTAHGTDSIIASCRHRFASSRVVCPVCPGHVRYVCYVASVCPAPRRDSPAACERHAARDGADPPAPPAATLPAWACSRTAATLAALSGQEPGPQACTAASSHRRSRASCRAAARAPGSRGGTRIPDRSSRRTSGIPPTRVPTTGRPLASASRTTFGRPLGPAREGHDVAGAHPVGDLRGAEGARADARRRVPTRDARADLALRDAVSDERERRARDTRRARASNASRSSWIPFCGSSRPTKSTRRASSATPRAARAARRSRG